MATMSWQDLLSGSKQGDGVRTKIGAVSTFGTGTATRILRDGGVDGGLVIGEEWPIQAGMRRVRFADDGIDERRPGWKVDAYRWEIVPPDDDAQPEVWNSRIVVVAEVPITRCWLRWAEFRRGSKKGRRVARQAVDRAFLRTVGDVDRLVRELVNRGGETARDAQRALPALETLRRLSREVQQELGARVSLRRVLNDADIVGSDPGCSTSDRVCAAICDPEMSLLAASGRNEWDGFRYAYGLLDDREFPEAEERKVSVHELCVEMLVRSACASELREMTAANGLKKAQRTLTLDDETIADCESFLYDAASLALAGLACPAAEADRWTGKPLVTLMESHYLDLIDHKRQRGKKAADGAGSTKPRGLSLIEDADQEAESD